MVMNGYYTDGNLLNLILNHLLNVSQPIFGAVFFLQYFDLSKILENRSIVSHSSFCVIGLFALLPDLPSVFPKSVKLPRAQ